MRAGVQEPCPKLLRDLSCDIFWHVQAHLVLAYRMDPVFAVAKLALHSYTKLRRVFVVPVNCRSC